MPKENLARTKRRVIHLIALLCCLGSGTVSWAEADDDNASAKVQVSDAIERYMAELKGNRYSRLNADVQPLDSRMQLAACAEPLEVEHYPKDRIGGRITFKVSCNTLEGWSVRVPANLQLFDSVVVASSSIPMGTQLTGNELKLEEMDVALLYRGYYHDITEVQGFITKRPIPGGQVLSPTTVNPANLVEKGETVSILAEAPGITIRAMGTALMNGALGDVIQVKNTKTNKVVEGRISAPGQIKVAL